MRATWDIFCNVVDNYGDIGIAWRLARGLVGEHGLAVRLWVDDLHAFQRIWPAIAVDVDRQTCESVAVCAWRMPFAAVQPAQVVIEAFGCALPESYLTAMSLQVPPPVWINLEYLSAEPWVAEHHGLPSPHPRLPLTKYFFFPGYTAGTGGLLAEADLAGRRAAFVRTGAGAFWRRLGLGAPQPEELRVSLFAYENPALPALLDAWAADTRPVTCLVPEGRVIPQLTAWLTVSGLQAGDEAQAWRLALRILPFLDQDTTTACFGHVASILCGARFLRAGTVGSASIGLASLSAGRGGALGQAGCAAGTLHGRAGCCGGAGDGGSVAALERPARYAGYGAMLDGVSGAAEPDRASCTRLARAARPGRTPDRHAG